MSEHMTINEFVKQMRELFPMCEYRAEKDCQVFKSKGWKTEYEDGNKTQVTPHVAKKMETKKRGRK